MRVFIKVKKIDVQLGDDATLYVDEFPSKGKEYVFRFKGELKDKTITQVNVDEDDEDVSLVFERTSSVAIVPADYDPTSGLTGKAADVQPEAVPLERR